MRVLFIGCVCLVCSVGNAQDIQGKWVGNYGFNIMSLKPSKVVVDLSVYNDSVLTGTSHLYYKHDNYEHYRIDGVYHKKDSTVYFKEDSTIGVKLGFGATNALCNYTMRLHVTDTMLYLNGILKENNAVFTIIPTKVWFAKPLDVRPAKPKPIDKNLLREIYIQNLIEIDDKEKDSIKIEIWDNEQVDGDVISLYENDSLILHNQKLESSHLVVYMSIDKANAISKLIFPFQDSPPSPPRA